MPRTNDSALRGERTVLFLDEIHRFNRAQQDILLAGRRSRPCTSDRRDDRKSIFRGQFAAGQPQPDLSVRALDARRISEALIERAASDKERGFGKLPITIDPEAMNLWAAMSDGDARRALSGLEVAVLSQMEGSGFGVQGSGEGKNSEVGGQSSGKKDLLNFRSPTAASSLNPEPRTLNPLHITLDIAEQSMQRKAIVYDGTGDEHYDAASALIKSCAAATRTRQSTGWRGCWRRVKIRALSPVGSRSSPAKISAMPIRRRSCVAAAAFDIVEKIGMPEAQLTLSQAAIYMATAPKSNASALAIWSAAKDVKEGRTLPVPKHLRDSHYGGAARLGHGEGYQYSHDFKGGFVRQDYLGVDKSYYQPTDRGYEEVIGRRMTDLRSSPAPEPKEPRNQIDKKPAD